MNRTHAHRLPGRSSHNTKHARVNTYLPLNKETNPLFECKLILTLNCEIMIGGGFIIRHKYVFNNGEMRGKKSF